MNFIKLLQSDYNKYKKYGGNFFTIVFFTQGFWAITQYRLAHSVYKMGFPIVKQLLQLIMLLWQKVIEITTGISIPASVTIGHSFYIGHFGGIILNAKANIGNNCNISQGVTIGVSGQGEKRGVPVIGNDVYIGANAVLAGKILIQNNAVIGACSLVTTDVEENAVMVGVPAVKVSEKGSKGYL
ncbi:serine O-acetyltransferase [Flavobacterium okayamense]|uniref:Serine acetyltransferase n=1 Tax=Flavobacterium okayamense TaxID=2830782 RepID=A0ABN6HRB3_9FLAO|nr:serine acetyltransferase [Flavobacterium okayamense]BCY27234.1 serine acetyltransferase [Flavobacterium okayamense]